MNTDLKNKDKLYRYISYERLLDYLVNERFSFIKYKLFDNDPWEGFFHKAFFKVNEYDSYSVMGENRPFIMCFTKKRVSEAMWRIYSKDTTGVQIVTSVERLKKLICNSREDFDCYLRKVVYDDDIQRDDFFIKKFPNATRDEKIIQCLFHKRKAFEHEEEVRLILYAKHDQPDYDVHAIYADPNEIIEAIILDPRINKETEKLSIMTFKKLAFKGIIVKSELYAYRRVWYRT